MFLHYHITKDNKDFIIISIIYYLLLHMSHIPIRYYLNYEVSRNNRIKQKTVCANKLNRHHSTMLRAPTEFIQHTSANCIPAFSSTQLYSILNYDKTLLCYDDIQHGIYRSVIFAFPENSVLGFSPPKSMVLCQFMQKYPIIDNNIIVNEMKSGLMVNLFFDYRIQQWEIATKGSIGGNYYFRKKNESFSKTQLTFYRMLLDALRATPDQELNDVAIVNMLPKNYSYTFILQHPENTIVIPVEIPALYLIAVYKTIPSLNCVEYIPATEYENWSVFQNVRGIIEFPKQYNHITEYNETNESNESNESNVRGVVFTNIQTGEHAVIESSKYIQLMKSIRIIPNLQYQYLCLRRICNIVDYLVHFPQYKKPFYKIRDNYEEFISNTYRSYMNYYVHQNTKCVDDRYYTHIVKIHKTIYLPLLKSKETTFINRKIVAQYFDKMEPRELLYLLNRDLVKYNNVC